MRDEHLLKCSWPLEGTQNEKTRTLPGAPSFEFTRTCDALKSTKASSHRPVIRQVPRALHRLGGPPYL